MRELANTDRVVEALHARAPQSITVESAAEYAGITVSQAYYRLERLHAGKLRVPGYAVKKEHGSLGEGTRGHGGHYTIVPVAAAVAQEEPVHTRASRAAQPAAPVGVALGPDSEGRVKVALHNGWSATQLPDDDRYLIKLPDGRIFVGKQV